MLLLVVFPLITSYSSVTGMTPSLGWDSLQKRRYVDSVTMMYIVVYNLDHISLPNSVQSSYSRTRANRPYKFLCTYLQIQMHTSILFSRLRLQLYSTMPMTKKKSKKSVIQKLPISCHKYSTSSGRCFTDIHSSKSEEEQPKCCL